jgi:hypothetical protein
VELRWRESRPVNFALIATIRDLLHAVKHDMGQKTLLPFRRKACWGFFSPLKIRLLRPGLNPRTRVPKASTLPLDHRSRFPLWFKLCHSISPDVKCNWKIVETILGWKLHFLETKISKCSTKMIHIPCYCLQIKIIFLFLSYCQCISLLLLVGCNRSRWWALSSYISRFQMGKVSHYK